MRVTFWAAWGSRLYPDRVPVGVGGRVRIPRKFLRKPDWAHIGIPSGSNGELTGAIWGNRVGAPKGFQRGPKWYLYGGPRGTQSGFQRVPIGAPRAFSCASPRGSKMFAQKTRGSPNRNAAGISAGAPPGFQREPRRNSGGGPTESEWEPRGVGAGPHGASLGIPREFRWGPQWNPDVRPKGILARGAWGSRGNPNPNGIPTGARNGFQLERNGDSNGGSHTTGSPIQQLPCFEEWVFNRNAMGIPTEIFHHNFGRRIHTITPYNNSLASRQQLTLLPPKC